MAIESDVLVIGGGLAGMTAAIAAAREGADVRLVSHKKSTLRQASGLVDVLGYVPDSDSADETDGLAGPIAEPLASLDELPGAHPYSVVGRDAVESGLAVFDDVAGALYSGEHTDRNALLPTFGGTVKPTARYPDAARSGLASDERPMLIVGFRSLTEYHAGVLAEGIASAGVPFDVIGVEVEFAEAFRDDATITRFARALDTDGPIDGTPAREALADAVEDRLDDIDLPWKSMRSGPGIGSARIGFPAFLGRTESRAVMADLEDRLGAPVFEIPMGPPSIPGRRLESTYFDALESAGVRYETGVPVLDHTVASRWGNRVVESALVDRTGNAIPYSASTFVLATGGLVGKGIESDREGVTEPVFGCHVPHPEDRYEWFAGDAYGDHPFARFGLRTDDDLRPLDAGGNPEFRNLFAAGAVLGGADVAREKSGSGVSLATGFAAGRNAARAVGD
ncbi:MAG: glycerol-3-phosphate dehydrogenase subunit GlpB [Halodesulfurarchaeum sp.]